VYNKNNRKRKKIDMENFFKLVLGESDILPGKTFTEYDVFFDEEKMRCKNSKTGEEYIIEFKDFTHAEFGIGSGNLWLNCLLGNKNLVFCSPRKSWKSDEGKKLIEIINKVTPIADMKEYKHYTGGLFFLYMFK
jgi:hypothetical protein